MISLFAEILKEGDDALTGVCLESLANIFAKLEAPLYTHDELDQLVGDFKQVEERLCDLDTIMVQWTDLGEKITKNVAILGKFVQDFKKAKLAKFTMLVLQRMKGCIVSRMPRRLLIFLLHFLDVHNPFPHQKPPPNNTN